MLISCDYKHFSPHLSMLQGKGYNILLPYPPQASYLVTSQEWFLETLRADVGTRRRRRRRGRGEVMGECRLCSFVGYSFGSFSKHLSDKEHKEIDYLYHLRSCTTTMKPVDLNTVDFMAMVRSHSRFKVPFSRRPRLLFSEAPSSS